MTRKRPTEALQVRYSLETFGHASIKKISELPSGIAIVPKMLAPTPGIFGKSLGVIREITRDTEPFTLDVVRRESTTGTLDLITHFRQSESFTALQHRLIHALGNIGCISLLGRSTEPHLYSFDTRDEVEVLPSQYTIDSATMIKFLSNLDRYSEARYQILGNTLDFKHDSHTQIDSSQESS